MRVPFILALIMLAAGMPALAKQSSEAAYYQLLQLTKMFGGASPFSCNAIVEVKYKSNAARPLRDTSKLIYRDRSTYYRSRIVERVEGREGELVINHELRTVNYHISDSLKQAVQRELKVKPNPEIEAMLEADVEGTDLASFRKFLVEECSYTWDTKEGLEEIHFTPKNPGQATLLSVRIGFSDSRVRYYEYTIRDVYATDYYGNSQFRVIRTRYQDFNYEGIAPIPVRFSDLLQWSGWTIKLKQHTDYKLSVL